MKIVIKVELDLSNYSTKADLKGATGADTSILAAKSDLASLKAEVDKINIDKLKTVPGDLSKLSNLVDNVVKKTVYDKLMTKVNAIDDTVPSTSGLVLKHNMILTNKVLRRILKMLIKRYLVLVD